jgi:hypothetical protein
MESFLSERRDQRIPRIQYRMIPSIVYIVDESEALSNVGSQEINFPQDLSEEPNIIGEIDEEKNIEPKLHRNRPLNTQLQEWIPDIPKHRLRMPNDVSRILTLSPELSDDELFEE